MNPLDDMSPGRPRSIPTGDPYLDVPLSVDCPKCSVGKRGHWCVLTPGATWSLCMARFELATLNRDHMRRMRAADSFLFCAMQTAVGDNPALRLKLIHEARDALAGRYPDWWTEADHVQLEHDAERYNARMAEFAANPSVKGRSGAVVRGVEIRPRRRAR